LEQYKNDCITEKECHEVQNGNSLHQRATISSDDYNYYQSVYASETYN